MQCSPAEEDQLTAALWEAGTSGIVEEPGGLRAFFEHAVNLEWLTLQVGRAPDGVRQERQIDWAQVSQDSFHPICIGQRFFMAPPWLHDPTPEGRFRLAINPGMACGTGYHQCTQMCLEAMERYVKPGGSLLDVGTGTGILSLAGSLLGTSFVLSCDVDAEAVIIARELVHSPVFVGSADAVRSGAFDLIVANISAAVVDALAGEFQRILKPGGRLILSGFTVYDHLESITPLEVISKDDWLCFVV
jgi:ribosomal protein L11 methyltransferase